MTCVAGMELSIDHEQNPLRTENTGDHNAQKPPHCMDTRSFEIRQQENANPCESPSGDEPARFACPYRKRNMARFNIRDAPRCATSGFGDLTTLKRHIRKDHACDLSPYRCDRCGTRFPTKKDLGDHLRAPQDQICPIVENIPCNDPEDGISDEIDIILAERKNDRKVNSWAVLWRIIFPDDEIVPLPDFEAPMVVEVSEVVKAANDMTSSVMTAAGSSAIAGATLSLDSWAAELDSKLRAICQKEDPVGVHKPAGDHSPTHPGFQVENPKVISGGFSIDPDWQILGDVNVHEQYLRSSWPNSMAGDVEGVSSSGAQSRDERRFHCNSCQATFATRKDLARHEATGISHRNHHDQLLFRCRCGYRSARKDNFVRHIGPCKRHMALSVYSCNCGALFTEKGDMLAHSKLCRHGSNPVGRPRKSRAEMDRTSPSFDTVEIMDIQDDSVV